MRKLLVVLAQSLQHPSVIESKLDLHDSVHFFFVFMINLLYLLLIRFRLFLFLYTVFVPLFVQISFDNFFQVLLKSLDWLHDWVFLFYSFTIWA